MTSGKPKIVCVDFDGVLHSYVSGWQGADVVSDPPVRYAIDWLRALVADARFEPAVYSSRSKEPGGIVAMQQWLLDHGLGSDEVARIRFPVTKPAASMTIDDRAFCFEGLFPTLDWIDRFVPWNRR